MNLEEFIDKWLNKKADFDGAYGGQCVDLYRYYLKEVLNFPQSKPVGGAAEIWHTASDKFFEFHDNTPDFVPERGDIAVFNRNVGNGYGHVSIVLSASLYEFTSFDQNFPTFNKVTKTKHTYKNVIGFMRPKEKESNMYKGLDLTNRKSMKVAVDAWVGLTTGELVDKSDLENCKDNLSEVKLKLKDEKNAFEGFLDEILDVIEVDEGGMTRDEKKKLILEHLTNYTSSANTVRLLKESISKQKEQIKKLENKITKLQKGKNKNMSDKLKKYTTLVGYLTLSNGLGYLLANYVAKDPALTAIFGPTINFIVYLLNKELKLEGYFARKRE